MDHVATPEGLQVIQRLSNIHLHLPTPTRHQLVLNAQHASIREQHSAPDTAPFSRVSTRQPGRLHWTDFIMEEAMLSSYWNGYLP